MLPSRKLRSYPHHPMDACEQTAERRTGGDTSTPYTALRCEECRISGVFGVCLFVFGALGAGWLAVFMFCLNGLVGTFCVRLGSVGLFR